VNPTLKQLGFAADDRVVILHADDIGMCQATLPAIADLFDFGLLSSAATMAPCPWFLEAAAFCRANPTVDMGVHLTLNCEWSTYRWGPISTRDPASGLLDEQGYFPKSPAVMEQQADPQAAALELNAQLTRALQAGMDPTHVDAHMGTAMRTPFLPLYIDVAASQRLPLFLVGPSGIERIQARGMGFGAVAPSSLQRLNTLAEQGIPLFDDLVGLPLNDPSDQVAVGKKIVDSLQPGLTMWLLHPAQDTPELRAMTPDWPSRVANYAACMSSELRDYVRQSGVQVIGYRPLRALVRGEQANG
jgi:predicted glycoside hydrolase/deacetylase ChbG (UPF0249 family)